jgi:hypothetical protein
MEEKAYEFFIKYINTHSLMSKNAAKTCAYFELEGRMEELSAIPGTESRIRELEEIKIKVMEI